MLAIKIRLQMLKNHLRSCVQLIEEQWKMHQGIFFFPHNLVVVDPAGDLATTQRYISPPTAVIPPGTLVSRILLLRQAHKIEAGH